MPGSCGCPISAIAVHPAVNWLQASAGMTCSIHTVLLLLPGRGAVGGCCWEDSLAAISCPANGTRIQKLGTFIFSKSLATSLQKCFPEVALSAYFIPSRLFKFYAATEGLLHYLCSSEAQPDSTSGMFLNSCFLQVSNALLEAC